MAVDIYVAGPKVGETIVIDLLDVQKTVVIDSAGDLSDRILKLIGRKKIDLLCLTHTHADHVSGAGHLFDYYDPESVVVFHPFAASYWLALSAFCKKKSLPLTEQEQKDLTRFESLTSKISAFAEKCKIGGRHSDFVRADSDKVVASTFVTSLNGLLEIEVVLPIGTVLEPVLASLNNKDPSIFALLPNSENQNPNDYCAGLEVRYGGQEFLFLADATSAMTDALADRIVAKQKKYAFVKASHHGSKNGNPQKLWDALKNRVDHVAVTRFTTHSLPETEIIKMIRGSNADVRITPLITSVLFQNVTGAGILSGKRTKTNRTPQCLKYSFSGPSGAITVAELQL